MLVLLVLAVIVSLLIEDSRAARIVGNTAAVGLGIALLLRRD